MILLQTHDPVEKVVAFYMEKLKSNDETGKPQAPTKSDSTMDGKPVVSLSQITGRTLKAAEIRQVDNMTMIELMRMDAPMPGSTSLPNHISIPGSLTTPGSSATPGSLTSPESFATPRSSIAPGSFTTPGSFATPGMRPTSGSGATLGEGTLGAPTASDPLAPGAQQQGPGLKYP
jgi:hypothetical protein